VGKAVALTIAGSDPSGGAGLQADLKTFHQFGVYGEGAITLLTVQNTTGVDRVEMVSPELVLAQVQAAIEDIPPMAAKTGALGNREMVEAIAGAARDWSFPLVVDPVMLSKHGARLLSPDAVEAFVRVLLPRAYLLTPNLPEAGVLTGMDIVDVSGMKLAARKLVDLGAKAVLVKGGHLHGEAVDVLYAGGEWCRFRAQRIDTPHTHGTGCTYSAAITAGLAKGRSLTQAVARAKQYISDAIETNPGLGKGSGPVNHHAAVSQDA
jgi:hydroxymethylpyrimidine/phosphomethylpyrimidine kinase